MTASWDRRSCATPEGETIPSHTRSELLRYLERLRLLKKQIATIKQRCKEMPSKTMPAVPMSWSQLLANPRTSLPQHRG